MSRMRAGGVAGFRRVSLVLVGGSLSGVLPRCLELAKGGSGAGGSHLVSAVGGWLRSAVWVAGCKNPFCPLALAVSGGLGQFRASDSGSAFWEWFVLEGLADDGGATGVEDDQYPVVLLVQVGVVCVESHLLGCGEGVLVVGLSDEPPAVEDAGILVGFHAVLGGVLERQAEELAGERRHGDQRCSVGGSRCTAMTLEVPFRGPMAKYDPPSAKERASWMSLARQVPGASFSNSGAP